MIVTNYLKSKGWNGAGLKTFKDYPHFEITQGFSLSEAKGDTCNANLFRTLNT